MELKTNIISKQVRRITLITSQNLKLPHITMYKAHASYIGLATHLHLRHDTVAAQHR